MFKLSKEDRLRREMMRGKYLDGFHWYGVMTHWGQEAQVRDHILKLPETQELREVVLPELTETASGKQSKRPALLFSGYVFMNCQLNDDLYMAVCQCPKIFQILGRSFRIPTVIDDAEIQHLKGLLVTLPRPKMVTRACQGKIVKVTQGIMTGLRGRLVEVSSASVKIETSFSFLGMESGIHVTLPHQCIRLLEQPEGQSPGDPDQGVAA